MIPGALGVTTANATPPAPALPPVRAGMVAACPRRRRLGRPRLLIVGCGDIGLRIVARLRGRYRIFATHADPQSAAEIRASGAVPLLLDLDRPVTPARLRGLAAAVLILAPATPQGRQDKRSAQLLRLLAGGQRKRMVYLSTSGVYGDRHGAWTDETARPAPGNERAWRRLDAEGRLRRSAWHSAVLRVPGIYAPERLPLERLRAGLPVALPQHDVLTNHIHADDLARACVIAALRAAPARVYNINDDSHLPVGAYLDRVADHAGLPRPPRLPPQDLRAALGEARMSFLAESRRMRNARMKRELRLRLRYPDVDAGLRAMNDYASNRPSTDK